MPQDRLTFLEDRVILIVSSLGLVCVAAAVLWVVRQSPDWGRVAGANHLEGEEHGAGDGALLGARTRVVPGGREATKAARKEAKKQAKEEFKRSRSAVVQERRNRLQREKRRQGPERSLTSRDRIHSSEEERRESSADAPRRLERYILDHKVSSLEDLQAELEMPSAEIVAEIEELEKSGVFTGVMVDDARGGSAFVRVSEEEMGTIASFINEKGRLTIEELVIEANRVLQLSGSRREGHEGAGMHQLDEEEEEVEVEGEYVPRCSAKTTVTKRGEAIRGSAYRRIGRNSEELNEVS